MQEQESEGADTVEAAADSAILPILGSVGSPGAKMSIQSLLCPVLKELHAIAPLRYGPEQSHESGEMLHVVTSMLRISCIGAL